MTSTNEMRKCLSTLPRNQWIRLDEIMKHIEDNIPLDKEDWSPLPTREPYPKWKHKLQSLLHNDCKSNKAEHRPAIKGDKPYYLFKG